MPLRTPIKQAAPYREIEIVSNQMTIEDFPAYAQENWDKIRESLLNRSIVCVWLNFNKSSAFSVPDERND